MSTQTRRPTATASFARRVLLLVMVAGIVDVDYRGYQVPDRIEILLRAAHPGTTPVGVYIGVRMSDRKNAQATHFYKTYPPTALHTPPYVGEVNTHGFYVRHRATTFCNILHQNTTEEEAFAYSLPVA